MNNEIGERNFRILKYFFDNKISVHFKDFDNIFYNGIIIDLNEKMLTMVLVDRVNGNTPFLLEHIKTDSIKEFREEKK